jgi:hypothetical protein
MWLIGWFRPDPVNAGTPLLYHLVATQGPHGPMPQHEISAPVVSVPGEIHNNNQ